MTTRYQYFINQRLATVQPCRVYDKLNPNGQEVLYRSPNFKADHFCSTREPPPPPKSIKVPSGAVQFSIPTLGLHHYIIPTIRHLIEAVRRDFKSCPRYGFPKIVILSNGNVGRPARDQFLREFIANNPGVDVTLITTPVPHKSNAINLLHQHALQSSSEIQINLDDDIRVPQLALRKLFLELCDGAPRFVGLRTFPDPACVKSPVENDLLRMAIAKRAHMGWPAPIGRINGFLTKIFPTITNYEAYDDVFLSAYFFINGIPQYVIDDPWVHYRAASSIVEHVKRARRIRRSDERIVELIPEQWRASYFNQIIRPVPRSGAQDETFSWLLISAGLSRFADEKKIVFGGPQPLDETDLSSKEGYRMDPSSRSEVILRRELEKLKLRHGIG